MTIYLQDLQIFVFTWIKTEKERKKNNKINIL